MSFHPMSNSESYILCQEDLVNTVRVLNAQPGFKEWTWMTFENAK